MSEGSESRPWFRQPSLILLIGLALIAGLLVSLLIPRPLIGVIRLYSPIYPSTADALLEEIHYARTHPEIRAVVLVLDSPGGTVVDTEAVYLELIKLRNAKPLVMYVRGMAASGAYYLAVAGHEILSGPSSIIGNVGVIASLPSDPFILEDIVTTGPYKMSGTPRDAALRELEMIKQGFYQAVSNGRADRLKISQEAVLSAQVWPANEALRFGLIDGLGAQTEAFNLAADLARIRHYQIAELQDLVEQANPGNDSFFLHTAEGRISPLPKEFGLFLLYIPDDDWRLP